MTPSFHLEGRRDDQWNYELEHGFGLVGYEVDGPSDRWVSAATQAGQESEDANRQIHHELEHGINPAVDEMRTRYVEGVEQAAVGQGYDEELSGYEANSEDEGEIWHEGQDEDVDHAPMDQAAYQATVEEDQTAVDRAAAEARAAAAKEKEEAQQALQAEIEEDMDRILANMGGLGPVHPMLDGAPLSESALEAWVPELVRPHPLW